VDDGILILEVPLLLPIPLGMPLLPFHDREYVLEDLLRLLAGAGFSIMSTWGVCRNVYVDVARAREAAALIACRDRV